MLSTHELQQKARVRDSEPAVATGRAAGIPLAKVKKQDADELGRRQQRVQQELEAVSQLADKCSAALASAQQQARVAQAHREHQAQQRAEQQALEQEQRRAEQEEEEEEMKKKEAARKQHQRQQEEAVQKRLQSEQTPKRSVPRSPSLRPWSPKSHGVPSGWVSALLCSTSEAEAVKSITAGRSNRKLADAEPLVQALRSFISRNYTTAAWYACSAIYGITECEQAAAEQAAAAESRKAAANAICDAGESVVLV